MSSPSCAGSFTAHLHFVAGAVLGVAGVLFLAASRIVSARQAEKTAGRLPTFYINLLLTNKKDVIKEQVSKRVPHGVFGLGRKLAASLATKVVSDAKFTRQIASKLASGIPEKLEIRDIRGEASVRFVKDNFAVVSCSIVSVDTLKLLGKRLDPDKMSKFNTMMSLLSSCGMRDSAEFALESQMVQIIEAKLREAMADEIMLKLKNEGGVESHVELKSEAEQPGFFFSMLADMEQRHRKGSETRSE